jgi:hypothetical protein
MSFSYAWYRCDQDGSGCSAVLNGTKPTYNLDPADYRHRMKVTVTATNSAGSSAADSATSEVVTDTTPPAPPSLTKPRRKQTLSTKLKIDWAGVERDAHYAIRYRESERDGSFGGYKDLVADTTDTSANLKGATGTTYCFSGRSTDQAGNTSDWSPDRCTAIPLDDRDLRASEGWRAGTSRASFLGTLTKTSGQGAVLSVADISVREISVVAQRCRGCGRLAVLLEGRRIGTVDLNARRSAQRQVIKVKRFTSIRRGDVELRVISSRSPVSVDGLVLSVL